MILARLLMGANYLHIVHNYCRSIYLGTLEPWRHIGATSVRARDSDWRLSRDDPRGINLVNMKPHTAVHFNVDRDGGREGMR